MTPEREDLLSIWKQLAEQAVRSQNQFLEDNQRMDDAYMARLPVLDVLKEEDGNPNPNNPESDNPAPTG